MGHVKKAENGRLYPTEVVTPIGNMLMEAPTDVLVFDDAMLEKYWNGLAQLDENDNLVDDEEAIQKLEYQNKIQNLQEQIDSLEKESGPRVFREFMLNTIKDVGPITPLYPKGKIKDIDDIISTLRKQIKDLT